MLVLHAREMRLKLLDQFLLVRQLFLDHFQLLRRLLQIRVVLVRYLQFDVFLLQLFDLLVQVVELGLVFLDLLFILVDPLLVLRDQLQLVFFELFNVFLPLVVAFALKELYLCLELLNHIVFLLELHVVEALRSEVAAFVAVNRRYQVFRVVPARVGVATSRNVPYLVGSKASYRILADARLHDRTQKSLLRLGPVAVARSCRILATRWRRIRLVGIQILPIDQFLHRGRVLLLIHRQSALLLKSFSFPPLPLLPLHLLPIALLSLEGNAVVDLVQDTATALDPAPCFLYAGDSAANLKPHLVQGVHKSLSHDLLENPSLDDFVRFPDSVRDFCGKFSPHCSLNGHDLGLTRRVKLLFQATAGLLLQENLRETDLELAGQLGRRFFQALEDCKGSVSRLRVVQGCVALQNRSVASDEVLEDDSDGVACLADADCFEHASASQLLQDVHADEVGRREFVVRLDAANVPRRGLAEGDDERGELLTELVRERVALEGRRLLCRLLLV